MIEVKDQLVEHTERVFDGTNPSDSLTIHDTDNTQVGADAQAHADLQANNQVRQASWHDQVDDTQAIRSYLPSAQCWHAGDGEGPGNTTSHAIEFCVNADGDLEKTLSNLVRLTVRRLDELDLTADDIVDHAHWSGKHCPRTFKDNPGSWERFIQAVKDRDPDAQILQGETMSKFSSPVPVGCRLTSGFGTRWGTLHAGTDWAPPKPGQTGIPVFAVHSGTVLATGTGYGRASDRIPYHSGRYVWLDIGVHGGDRMRIYYGHLASVNVKSGQKVTAGQQLGIMGSTGNVTGIHLHLGVSVNHNRPTVRWTARTNSGWTDPARWLRSKGITPGKTAPATSSVSAATASVSASPKGAGKGEWPTYPLVVDGKFWLVTKRGYQRLLAPASVGNYKGRIDGDIGPLTVNAEQRWLKNRGYYKGRIDGQRGPMTIRALQSRLKNDGFYPGIIDGQFGPLSVKGLQRLMNSQQNLYK
jgi:murein DD-endopeptidase MepM/ murein hydrolase activator NlpD